MKQICFSFVTKIRIFYCNTILIKLFYFPKLEISNLNNKLDIQASSYKKKGKVMSINNILQTDHL